MATYSSNKNCRSKPHSSTVGNCMENEGELKLNVKLSKISSTRQSSSTIRTSIIALNMVLLTPEQRTFVIKTFYETGTLQQTRGAFGLINFAYD